MRLRSISMLCAAGLLACTAERKAPSDAEAPHQDRFDPRDYSAAAIPAVTSPGLEQGFAVTAASAVLPRIPADATSSMVIRTANASIEVDSLERAVARVRELATRVGGYVANVSVQTGDGQLHRASLELKIPAPRFDEGLGGLAPIGKLESVNVSAADVGEEYVDVMARIENARRLERRLIELLANRTGKLKDVLDVEQALARVREEIERHEGRIRYLREHAATSALTVYVHEPLPVVGSAGTSVMGEAFRQAWRNFVTLLALLVQSLGVVIPLGALAVVAWVATRRWRRVITQRAE